MVDGAYRYFPSERSSHSIVCEIACDFVSECGEEGWRPVSAYAHGKFVSLIELPDISELAAWWPALPDLQGGLDLFAEYPISGEVTS
jgi:hypothetical protein